MLEIFGMLSTRIDPGISVTYWPSTQPSIEKQVDQDISLTVDGLISVQMRRSQEAGGRQTIIYPGATESRVSWSQAVEVLVAVRGSENQLPAEGWALGTPG